MNRILLAYSTPNIDLAEAIDHKLSRIGIPFEHITDAEQPIAATLAATNEPILLLISDNFLKNRQAVEGMLNAIAGFKGKNQVLIVLCDGKNAAGNSIETHIDRMVNALHYMTHWQNIWLGVSEQYQSASGEAKKQIEEELDRVQLIANQMGDLIGALRETGYITLEQLESNDFERFFNAFGLSDWHGQYKHLEHSNEQSNQPTEPVSLPPTPVLGGVLSPEPVVDTDLKPLEIPELAVESPETIPVMEIADLEPVVTPLVEHQDTADFGLPSMESLLGNSHLTELEIAAFSAENTAPQISDADITQTISDACLWVNNGQPDRGFALFEAAIEQYPEVEAFKTAYEKAKNLVSPTEIPEVIEIEPSTPVEVMAASKSSLHEEARSYDMMGDMAVAKGDYLFAKYCWDRASEIEPNYPDIFSKLGVMTAEHLRDYKETAVHYLHKALEYNPKDAQVHLALAQFSIENRDLSDAKNRYNYAISLDNTLRSNELDALFETKVNTDSNVQVDTAPIVPEPNVDVPFVPVPEEKTTDTEPVLQPVSKIPKNGKTVLITGATSGIGKATAAIFAQNGYRLILTGRRIDRLIEIKKYFEETWDTEMLMLPFDVRDAGAVEAALSNLPEGWHDIDVLVNNAGLAKGLAPIHEGDIEHWETMIDTNIKGLLYVTRFISPNMVKRRQGHIINICSTAGKETYPNGNVYSATKFAVDALTKSMRFDLHQHNIKVSQVSPGHVEETEFALTRFDGDADRASIYNDFQPLKSSDVAEVIYFMATRPAHVNIQDILMMATQQASAMIIDRSGR